VDFTELFVGVDDFWMHFEAEFEHHLLADGHRRRRRDNRISISEIMTILIAFQAGNSRTFKHFYLYLLSHRRDDFPGLVCYGQFVRRIPQVMMPLFAYLMTRCLGPVTGISFIDSTAIKVCHNKRIKRNRVFDGLAQIGKSTMGWFYGFKLHRVINERGDLLALALAFTPGNIDDRKPVESMSQRLWGKLFGDKGYISQKRFNNLYQRGIKLITNTRKNMKSKLISLEGKILLRKRSLIETVNDQLKNVCQIEHTRHRSPVNFLVHLIAGLIAYTKPPKRPSINFDIPQEYTAMTIA